MMYTKQLTTIDSQCKLRKLRTKVQDMSALLTKYPKDFRLHQRVSEFYYLQKESELTVLLEKLDLLMHDGTALLELVEMTYQEVLIHWRHDVRWTAAYAHAQCQAKEN